ncbi:MAG: HDOD domain-containing protein [Acidobacteria bacterium]|nr:HDOD domain-containing protein [Acidobacteriota bacterium]
MALPSTKNHANEKPPSSPENESGSKFIARQPIFDRQQQVYGYELLPRPDGSDLPGGPDSNKSPGREIGNHSFHHSIGKLVGNRKAFLSFSRELLLSDPATFFRKDATVINIPKAVELDAEMRTACRRLKTSGYCLALDDVDSMERPIAFLDLLDFIRVDFSRTAHQLKEELVANFAPCGIALLATHVETQEEVRQAEAAGFEYFQGSFFRKPQFLPHREIPPFQLNYLHILQAVNRPEINLREIEQIIKREAIFSYKLLHYLNSPFFGFRNDIRSIRHALSLLGRKEFKVWASALAVASMGVDQPAELVISSFVRAVWCKELAAQIAGEDQQEDFFLLGLFSMLDGILGRPMPEVLSCLPLPDELKTALLPHRSTYAGNLLENVIAMVQAYEQGDWETFAALAAVLKVAEETMPETYLRAIEWAHQVFQLS